MKKYELEFENKAYDAGYGEMDGTIILTVTPVYTDERFDAYNLAGSLQTFGEQYALSGFTVTYAEFFGYGNNGVELGSWEITEEIDEILDHDTILEKLQQHLSE